MEALLAALTQETGKDILAMNTPNKPVIDYCIGFKFINGEVRIALREDEDELKILGMDSHPKRRGLGRKALQLLKEKGLVGRPVNIRHQADKFWVKMRFEELVK